MRKNIYVACGYRSYANWFLPLGFSIVDHPDKADVLLLAGGTDCPTSWYGEQRGSYTQQPDIRRDEIEYRLYHDFVKSGRHIWGTCRGVQALTAFNGGKLVQHSHHPGSHPVYILGQEQETKWHASSCHHQQCLVLEEITGLREGDDYILEAWTKKISNIHLDENDQNYNFLEDYREPEVLWFPKTLSGGSQGHPEFCSLNSGYVKYCQNIVRKYFLNEPEVEEVYGIGQGRAEEVRELAYWTAWD